jgi:hypothetical protein
MFPNLCAELARNKLSIKKLSKMSGIKYDSLKNKLAGNTEFKRNEMFLIKSKVFPNMSIDYLFATDDEPKKAG